MSKARTVAQIAQQAIVEQQALQHVIAALQVALGWSIDDHEISRKASTVRFIAQSLERHLERLLALEEEDGYLEAVVESKPHLQPEVRQLQSDHDQIRARLRAIMGELKDASEFDREALDHGCAQLNDLLAFLADHDRREAELMQVATLVEEGTGD